MVNRKWTIALRTVWQLTARFGNQSPLINTKCDRRLIFLLFEILMKWLIHQSWCLCIMCTYRNRSIWFGSHGAEMHCRPQQSNTNYILQFIATTTKSHIWPFRRFHSDNARARKKALIHWGYVNLYNAYDMCIYLLVGELNFACTSDVQVAQLWL